MLVEFNRDLAQLVAHTSGGREVAGSSPVIPTENERIERFPRFFVSCMQVLSATHACESPHSKVYRHGAPLVDRRHHAIGDFEIPVIAHGSVAYYQGEGGCTGVLK